MHCTLCVCEYTLVRVCVGVHNVSVEYIYVPHTSVLDCVIMCVCSLSVVYPNIAISVTS